MAIGHCSAPPIPCRACSSTGLPVVRFVESPFVLERPGVASAMIYMSVEGIVFTILVMLLEV